MTSSPLLGFVSLATAGVFVAFGVRTGYPISTAFSVSGSGYVAGMASVSERKLGITALGWVGSFVGAFAVGFGVFAVTG